MLRFLVADDHSGMRRCVGETLESEEGWVVCGVAATGAEAVAMTAALRPDFVVLDICMPEMNGLEAARHIRTQFPQISVLILTMHDARELADEALASGAAAFLLKTDLHRLPDAVRSVSDNRLAAKQGARIA
jgi:DNA-binding NarL/FixJ family response regulator